MDYQKLADLLFADNKLTATEIEKKYPKRNLPDGAQVTRYAPSPTGFMHLGNFFQAFISSTVARMSNGIFYLRNEDTDKKREVEGASAVIMGILFDYGIMPAEYELKGGVTVGNYGPYYQSERVEIYKAYAKKLVSEGKAFPCFCDKASGIGEIKEQREKKFAVGLSNDDKDPCRNLTFEQIEKFVKEGKKFAIRLKSNGNSKNKVEFFDVLKGKISMEENSKDVVILKSDGLPPYHFAHAIDDTLMGTTLVVRGEEWLPSTPVHIEIFKALGFKPMIYLHNPLICIKEGEKKRKVSKRKDKEFDMRFYAQAGYPVETICEYIMNLINSGFEMWRKNNPNLPYTEYHFKPLNITASSPVLDMDKFNDISKEVISKYTAEKCYELLLAWPPDDGAPGHLKRRQRHRYAGDQHQIEQICPHNIAQRKTAMALRQSAHRRHQLWQRGSQRDERQRNHGLRHAQLLGNQDAVIHQQSGSQGDQYRSRRQQNGVLRCGPLSCGSALPGGSGAGRPFDLPDGDGHIGGENRQQNDSHHTAEIAGGIGYRPIDPGGGKEKDHRRSQRPGIHLAGAHRNGDGGNQRGVADHGADGVAISNLPVTAQSGSGGNHHLRQSRSDGNHGRPDQQLRHTEAVCDVHRAVHKPVAALDQKNQPHKKQNRRNKHTNPPIFKGRSPAHMRQYTTLFALCRGNFSQISPWPPRSLNMSRPAAGYPPLRISFQKSGTTIVTKLNAEQEKLI